MARRRKPVTLFDVIQKGSPVMLSPRRADPVVNSSRIKLTGSTPIELPRGSSLRERLAYWLLSRSTGSAKCEVETTIPKEKPVAFAPPTEPQRRSSNTEFSDGSSRTASNAMERLRAELRSAPSIVEEQPPAPTETPLISKEEITELQQIEIEPKGPSALSTLTTKLSREATEFFDRFGSSARQVGRNVSQIRFRMPSWMGRATRSVNHRHLALIVGMGGLFVFSFAIGRMLLQKQPDIRADVLEVEHGKPAIDVSANLAPAPVAPPIVEKKIEANVPVSAVPKRTPKLNYVIIQSYLNEVDATAAVDVLAANSIQATVEVNLPNWGSRGSTWYSVVGVIGFERMSNNPTYADYIQKLTKISDSEYNRTINKRFAPTPYRWPE